VALLRDYITHDVCSAVSRGIFSHHRLTYALLTAVQVGLSYCDWISKDEFDAFLRLPDVYVHLPVRCCSAIPLPFALIRPSVLIDASES
jgi:hypothetical protein